MRLAVGPRQLRAATEGCAGRPLHLPGTRMALRSTSPSTLLWLQRAYTKLLAGLQGNISPISCSAPVALHCRSGWQGWLSLLEGRRHLVCNACRGTQGTRVHRGPPGIFCSRPQPRAVLLSTFWPECCRPGAALLWAVQRAAAHLRVKTSSYSAGSASNRRSSAARVASTACEARTEEGVMECGLP